jgi:hypothetical protein
MDDKVEDILEDMSQSLEDWVIEKRNDWRDDYEANYKDVFEEYYRLWRAQWAKEDSQRDSERSRIISPALQQAVESNVAEVEEATFGRGKWFDLVDDLADEENTDMEILRRQLQKDFDKAKVRKSIGEILINSAVFGTGVGEIVVEMKAERRPASRPTEDGGTEGGIEKEDRFMVGLRPVLPQNFLMDPVATDVNEAVGCIIDEFVPRHTVELLQESGVYKDTYIEDASVDTDIEPDQQLGIYPDEKIRLVKYYGLVPTSLLVDAGAEVDEDAGMYTEAIVVLANDGVLLKAIASPYMMQDRPIVAFPWDVVPGRFWGRGVCEKGYMSQKALDTEMRARIDALALTVHPMMAMDISRLPKGTKPKVRPGNTIFTNGPPAETLMPFKFGNLDQNTFTQAQALQQMVQQATGAVDSTGLLSSISGETKAGAVSMSLGAVIKRHKRTLVNFQESFLLPFVKMAAYRYMQFDPKRYPSRDFEFSAVSTLGIIAREYEVSQLITLLQTMSADSPLYPALVQSIVENMNLSNREQLIKVLQEASQPSEEEQQMQQEQRKLANERQQAEIDYFKSQAADKYAEAELSKIEAQEMPKRTQYDMLRAITNDLKDDQEDKSFEKRLAILDRMLKEKDLDIKAGKQGESNANTNRTGGVEQSVQALGSAVPRPNGPTEGN